jgi:hypothetical protein
VTSKIILFALLAVFPVSATGFAADAETTKLPAADGISPPSGAASFFEGVWAGTWPWGGDGVELTIAVAKKNRNGLSGTTYSWGMGRYRNGTPIKSGSFKVWGKEQGDRFRFEWKTRDGVNLSITLIKTEKEDSVKAVWDTDASTQLPMSDRVTYLKRK